jgi:competence protein ComEC
VLVVWLMGRRNTVGEAARRLAWVGTGTLWLGLAVVLGRARPDPYGDLRLHFLDVGQGDAAVIRTPQGHWLLVDAGPRTSDWDAGRNVVGPFLRRHGVSRVSMIVVSHAHADHLGGVPWVVDHFRVDQVVEPGDFDHSPLYLEFLEDLDRREVAWHVARAGATFELDGVHFAVLHPDTAWAEWGEDLNEDSVVLQVRYGDFEALFAGDVGFPVERLLHHVARPVEVLKVGHHGSAGSTGRQWLGDLRPRAAVVSVGHNRYGHPAPAALARLRAAGVEVWRTDREGTILVATDGHRVSIRGADRAAAFAATP